jgi:hypothetical protein
MNWLSAVETEAELKEINFDISPFWAVSRFLSGAFYSEDFEVNAAWSEVIKLTPEGETAKAILVKNIPESEPSQMSFFLFADFYRRNLLIDCASTELDSLMNLLRKIDSSGQARWPNVFGKEVYDKFNATYDGNRTEFLEAHDFQSLLDGTPHGIFQVGNLTCGPLGFFNSAERRLVAPTLRMPLWHCSDTGCRALHQVKGGQYESAFTKFRRNSSRLLSDHFGPSSEWDDTLDRVARGEDPSRGRPYSDITTLICDCIVGSELLKLATRALKSAPGNAIKTEVSQFRKLTGSPEEIAKRMTVQERQQFLLLLRDRDLVDFIDELVVNRSIDIPPSEVRSPKTTRREEAALTPPNSLLWELDRFVILLCLDYMLKFGTLINCLECSVTCLGGFGAHKLMRPDSP